MKLDEIHSIYFIGIGGIGMSALARYFHLKGTKVSGYDKAPTALTGELISEGIPVHFYVDINLIPKDVDLVVYTPAVPPDHEELAYYREHQYHIVKRSDLLEWLTRDHFTIAVAGTHGKTTTSSMIAHILKSSGYDCTAFLGGISVNYHSNFISGKNNTMVVEADEFDRSFLKLYPDIAAITSCDPDHLDIYNTYDEVVRAFGDFASLIKDDGKLITKKNLPFLKYLLKNIPVLYYGLNPDDGASFYAEHLQIEEGKYTFDFKSSNETIDKIHLGVPGLYNVENAVAAIAVALQFHINKKKIKEALSSFKGVKRRFEYILHNESIVYIDDYAHHPAEITALLKSVKEIYPDKRITCIFQPHLYTRTRDFAEGFGESLSLATEAILLPIYPARELPIDGVSSQMLLDYITVKDKVVCGEQELIEELKKRNLQVLLTVGAGDIDQLVEPIKTMLEGKVRSEK